MPRYATVQVGKQVKIGSKSYKVVSLKKNAYKIQMKGANMKAWIVELESAGIKGFRVIYHFPATADGMTFSPLSGRMIPAEAFGSLIADTFKDKKNLKILRAYENLYKTAYNAYAKYLKRKPQVNLAVAFSPVFPVAMNLTVAKSPGLVPDVTYTIKDRNALEEAGMVIKDMDIQLVYGLILGNFKKYKGKVINDYTDESWWKAIEKIMIASKDPLFRELVENYRTFIKVAEGNGKLIPLTHEFVLQYRIPLGGKKGSVRAMLWDYAKKQQFSLVIPNPNKNGRKRTIKAESFLFYDPLAKWIYSKHNKSAQKKNKKNVLTFDHILLSS